MRQLTRNARIVSTSAAREATPSGTEQFPLRQTEEEFEGNREANGAKFEGNREANGAKLRETKKLTAPNLRAPLGASITYCCDMRRI